MPRWCCITPRPTLRPPRSLRAHESAGTSSRSGISEELERESEDLARCEASGGWEDAQPDHPDPSGHPRGVAECLDGDVALLRLRHPEDHSGLGLVDAALSLHTFILRERAVGRRGG